MRVDSVLETCLYVDDLAAALVFYRDVLGLEAAEIEEGRHLFFRCGRGMLLLFNPERTGRPNGDVPRHGCHGSGHVAFTMPSDQVDSWRQQLRRHGVEIEREISNERGRWSIYFRDPAGNSLELATVQTWGLPEPPAA